MKTFPDSGAIHIVKERKKRLQKTLLFSLIGSIIFVLTCTGANFVLVYLTTSDSAQTADTFLKTISSDNLNDAYELGSDDFKQAQSLDKFIDMITGSYITSYKLTEWHNRTLNSSDKNIYTGTLSGISNKSMPFNLTVVKEQGSWKIFSLTGPGRYGVGPGTWFRQVPASKELQLLAKNTMLDFDKAVREKSFVEFYNNMWTFRSSISLWKFQATFEKFIQNNIDLSSTNVVAPTFIDEPSLERSPSGTLLVTNGIFDTENGSIPFTFRYLYDHPNWKLININVGFPGDPTFNLRN